MRRNDADSSAAEWVSRYWDAVVTGRADLAAAEEMDPADMATIAALHAGSSAPEPEPAFVARLEAELLAASLHDISHEVRHPAIASTMADQAELRESVDPGAADRASGAELVPARRSWWREGMGMLAAVCVLVALAGLLTLTLREQGANGGQDAGLAVGSPPVTDQLLWVGGLDPETPINQVHLFVGNADGSEQRILTEEAGDYRMPAWSPDGQWIAFVAGDRSESELYVMRADGSEVRQLTDDDLEKHHPVWSPDGEQLAVTCISQTEAPRICIVDATATDPGLTEITEIHGLFPAWSPDGSQLAFIGEHAGGFGLHVVARDGSRPRRLTDGLEMLAPVAWSPDGQQIVFSVVVKDEIFELFVVDVDDGDVRQLTNFADGPIWGPKWSPDGQQIAFVRQRDLNDGVLVVMNADGSEARVLTPEAGVGFDMAWSSESTRDSTRIAFGGVGFHIAWSPDGTRIAFGGVGFHIAWSPDGTRIAFVARNSEVPSAQAMTTMNAELMVINVDGTGLTTVAQHVPLGSIPAWRPGGVGDEAE